MRPNLTADDVADGCLVKAVSIGDGLLRHLRVQPADVSHVILGDLRHAMRGAVGMSQLGSLVFVVVRGASKPEMVWVYARRVVAAVTHVSAFRHGAIHSFVRYSMRSELSPVVIGDDPVAVGIDGAGPRPACVGGSRLVVVEESFGERTTTGGVTAGLRAVLGSLARHWFQLAVRAHAVVGAALKTQPTAAFVARWVGTVGVALSALLLERPSRSFHASYRITNGVCECH